MKRRGIFKFTLPSGKVFSAAVKEDPRRPWEIHYGQGGCQLARPRRGDSSQVEFYKEASTLRPLVVDEADAQALVTILRSLRKAG